MNSLCIELKPYEVLDMAKVILGVTISLDGFAEDKSGSVDPLYPDLKVLRDTDVLREAQRNVGAVIMSWKEFTMAEAPRWFADNYEFQVPVFVFTDKISEKQSKENILTFTLVKDGIESAVRQAKAAAGDKHVVIIGSAKTVQDFLQNGIPDELHVDIIPTFLHEGTRPFEGLDRSIKLERTKVVKLPAGRTHLRFQVFKS
jgi:dihydrofolate reductase